MFAIYTPPAWIVSVLCVAFGLILARKAQHEKTFLLYGKIGTLLIVAMIYILFSIDFFDVYDARALARYAWILYLISEISYHFTKYYDIEKRKWNWTA